MKTKVLLMAFFGMISSVFANNINVTNATITNRDTSTHTAKINFDVSWENSWRTTTNENNYDGAWIFVKYQINGTGAWRHCTLKTSGFTADGDSEIKVAPIETDNTRGKGAFIYRNVTSIGIGNISFTGNQLVWDYAIDGVLDNATVQIKVFAIEMVYIPAPTGARCFFGDGDGSKESLNALHYADNLATNNSVLPISCDANGFDDSELEADGIYIYSNDTLQTTNPIGALEPFPTMKALWCMKYEINQAGYRDFLNTLDSLQQVNRIVNAPTSAVGTSAFTVGGINNRNFIEVAIPASLNNAAVFGCDANGNNIFDEAADGEWIACNFLGWPDVAAYLDWSGLAPMSELQFERICRGNSSAGGNAAVYGEYAWGNNLIFANPYTLTGGATASETASNASAIAGNAIYNLTTSSSPLRSGVFATPTSNRTTSGSTYYGVMEMSGNLPEYCITLGSLAGRSCHYIPNGNGFLSNLGNAQLSVGGAGFWPGMEGNLNPAVANTCSGTCEVTSAAGIRFRGGSITDPASSLSVSDRGTVFTPTARANNRGGRGVLYIR